jgi:pilus assembly protein CpaD
MMLRISYAALPLLLALSACQPGVATYTAAEAPKDLVLNSTQRQVVLRFLPGSARLAPADAQRLTRLALAGAILPSDRVSVAAAGPRGLEAARQAAIARALLPYRIVARPAVLPRSARNHATVTVERTLVTLPPCPNWSGPTPEHFDNQPSSNFGCATAVNRGMMVASPSDLAGGQPLGPADAAPAVIATDLYRANKVPPPMAVSGMGGGAAPTTPTPGAGVSTGGM